MPENTPQTLSVEIPVEVEILARFRGSNQLHLLGTTTAVMPVNLIAASADAPVTFQFAPGVF